MYGVEGLAQAIGEWLGGGDGVGRPGFDALGERQRQMLATNVIEDCISNEGMPPIKPPLVNLISVSWHIRCCSRLFVCSRYHIWKKDN